MNQHLIRFSLFSLLSILCVINCHAQGGLKEAIQSNDLRKVRGILQVLPGEVNACLDTQVNCIKPLYLAVQQRLPEMVQVLIKSGADVNFGTGGSRISPLYRAVQLGFTEIAEILLKNGAKVDVRLGDERLSLLDTASRSGNLEMTKVLLNNKAQVNTEARMSKGS